MKSACTRVGKLNLSPAVPSGNQSLTFSSARRGVRLVADDGGGDREGANFCLSSFVRHAATPSCCVPQSSRLIAMQTGFVSFAILINLRFERTLIPSSSDVCGEQKRRDQRGRDQHLGINLSQTLQGCTRNITFSVFYFSPATMDCSTGHGDQ